MGLDDRPAPAPGGDHRGAEMLGDRQQLGTGARVDDAGTRVQQRMRRAVQHPRCASDLLRVGGDRRRPPVGVRRADLGLHERRLGVHQVLGDVDVHDPRASRPGRAERAPHHLADPIHRRDGLTRLAHRRDDTDLVEVLEGPATLGVGDAGTSRGGDQQHPVALALLDSHAGDRVGHTRTVGGHRHAEPPGCPGVGAGHVQCGGLVPRSDQGDPIRAQLGVEPEVGAVDDAEDDLDTLGPEHPGHQLATGQLGHVVLPTARGSACIACEPAAAPDPGAGPGMATGQQTYSGDTADAPLRTTRTDWSASRVAPPDPTGLLPRSRPTNLRHRTSGPSSPCSPDPVSPGTPRTCHLGVAGWSPHRGRARAHRPRPAKVRPWRSSSSCPCQRNYRRHGQHLAPSSGRTHPGGHDSAAIPR